MYEKGITQILEKLDDNERKEVLDFAEFINHKHKAKNKVDKKKMKSLTVFSKIMQNLN